MNKSPSFREQIKKILLICFDNDVYLWTAAEFELEKLIQKELLSLLDRVDDEVIGVPLRSGDNGPDDEIIPDGIVEAFVRDQQRQSLAIIKEEIIK